MYDKFQFIKEGKKNEKIKGFACDCLLRSAIIFNQGMRNL